jgi:hypothetical protein
MIFVHVGEISTDQSGSKSEGKSSGGPKSTDGNSEEHHSGEIIENPRGTPRKMEEQHRNLLGTSWCNGRKISGKS